MTREPRGTDPWTAAEAGNRDGGVVVEVHASEGRDGPPAELATESSGYALD